MRREERSISNQEVFKTSDIYISAAISILLNVQPDYRVERGLTLFLFPVTDALHKAINDFHDGVKISAYQYAQTMKRLRTEMYNAKVGMK